MQHWRLLVTAYKILNSNSISDGQLLLSQNSLSAFSASVVELYLGSCFRRSLNQSNAVMLVREHFYGLNHHSLLHVGEMVEAWGPLWGFSLYSFESKNGWITRHCHAKNGVIRTLMRQLLASQVQQKNSAGRKAGS